ncbi:hypothetical protein PSN45_003255 [Yamadazyma tenuis]|uniref:Splicing factor U2AF 23 kDa subunit n=1 Tax=Candida tenuis (strain ATCC 10573 / BCRC 21748 / CBS 615 / JCM 9827 / NBRC 10315 / NRRL Y-1498 / VKM Y-70) TaxID=590646 RepID=G3AYV8_CANTC|nr:splicing factor U2AF 23 kDa subunit [Yamadazyma tenuis ATCC 10573]EGV65941.1 splicing factor U2AF 23 kDa subunit [Yamadazyma tenuis ATCC 10573]WEJ95728.1 hypothetical protein PSN45_003255 [Yamadazyma tenuis]
MSDFMNCQFYTKIGACRHGEKCSKRHTKPLTSYTVLLANLYQNPKLNKNEQDLNPKQIREYFENFYKDVFIRLGKIEEIAALVVCENENNHLNGNVYCRFKNEEGARRAVVELNQEWFGSRPVHCELSPVQSFHDANCRDYDTNSCSRDHCNFMHVIRPSDELERQLFSAQAKSVVSRKILELKFKLAQANPPVSESTDFKSTVEALFKVGQK